MGALNVILLNISLLLYCGVLFYFLIHQFHMLQLNSYRNDRYGKWVRENFNKELSIWSFFPLISTCLILKDKIVYFFILFVLFMAIDVIFMPKPAQKKKFVYTARVKRLFATFGIIVSILFSCLKLLTKNNKMFNYYSVFAFFFVMSLLYIFRYIYVYIINCVNIPVEKAVANWYIKDAKKKLSGMPNLTVIGITGSYGKTSTKYILHRILSEKYNVLMTPESYNTPLGVTRTIREQLSPKHEIFIVEMGAKQVGDIKEICDIVKPRHCIVTSVGPCHLESFKSIENVLKTKMELFEASTGMCFLNFDSELINKYNKQKDFISFGTKGNTTYYASDIFCDSSGMNFKLNTPKGNIELKTKLLGASNALNITAAAGMAIELGLSADDIKFAVSQLKPIPHRLEMNVHPGNYIILDDAYNSNPAGAKEALNVLKSFNGFFRVLISPGMVELGDKEYEENFEFGRHAADCADFVIAVGTKRSIPIVEGLKEKNYNNIYIAKNLKEALTKLSEIKQDKTVVLLENDLPDNYEE